MDLQFLLMLQNFRNGAGSFLIRPMLIVSDLTTYGSAVLCIVIYWAFSRSLGYWLMTNVVTGFFVNNVIKLTACIYRPWIRSPLIVPPESAMESATGYSFPSGHTQISSSFFGSCAVRTGKEHAPVRVVCVLAMLLTGFSRVFLGVHTPQDILVSYGVAALLLWLTWILFNKIEQTPSLLYPVIAAGVIAVIAAIVYFHLKAYPLEYIDGELIVDPEKMKMDGYASAGVSLGFLAGVLVETRFIRFHTESTVLQRVLRVLLGIPVPLVLLKLVRPFVYKMIGEGAGHVVVYGIILFYIVALYPALFTAVESKLKKPGD